MLSPCILMRDLYRMKTIPSSLKRETNKDKLHLASPGERSRGSHTPPCAAGLRFPAACAPASPRALALLRPTLGTNYVAHVGSASASTATCPALPTGGWSPKDKP